MVNGVIMTIEIDQVNDGLEVVWDYGAFTATFVQNGEVLNVVSYSSVESMPRPIGGFVSYVDPVVAHREALQQAREILLDYGTPDGFTFEQTLFAVQTAVVEYRDSGFKDPECEENLIWISLRSNEITTLRSLGILP